MSLVLNSHYGSLVSLTGSFTSYDFSSNLMGVNSLAFSKMNKSQDGDRPKQMSSIPFYW